MLNVLDKYTHEERLSEAQQTNDEQNKLDF